MSPTLLSERGERETEEGKRRWKEDGRGGKLVFFFFVCALLPLDGRKGGMGRGRGVGRER